ncbi:MAG: M28 family peptidase, partial [Nitrospinales bacterium]
TDHLKALVSERNHQTSLSQLRLAGDYVATCFESLGLPIQKEAVAYEGTETCNVLALKEGTDPDAGLFIIGAHYDTVIGSPGADDNASAVAALLEIARCLKDAPLKTPLLFAGFTLEEYGFIGSTHYLEQAKRRNEKIIGMISLEMLGCRRREPGSQEYPPYVDRTRYPDTGNFVAVVGNEPSQQLTVSLAETMKKTVAELPVEILVVPGRGDPFTDVRLSDHAPFWDYGYEAVMVTDTAFFRNPNYHQATDTLDTIDVDFVRDITTGLAGFLESHLG